MRVSRREFMKLSVLGGCLGTLPGSLSDALASSTGALRKASFFSTLPNATVRCDLCYHSCTLQDGEMGNCRNRLNHKGTLFTLTYGRPVALHTDPIEKLPLRHVLPGKSVLSVGTAGCNLTCLYCINHAISRKSSSDLNTLTRSPRQLVDLAQARGLPGIAFTYNEPTIAYEFMLEAFVLARKAGLKTFWHTNGYIQSDPLAMLLRQTDAVVVDLKAARNSSFNRLAGGQLALLKKTLQTIRKSRCLLEIVILLVPGYNTSTGEIAEGCRYLLEELGPDIPLHFSRFFPSADLSHLPPTPSGTIHKAISVAHKKRIHYVYANNIAIRQNDTCCPACQTTLISRKGTFTASPGLKGTQCIKCGLPIPGIWTI